MDGAPENDERMQILEMIADGKISASDGIRLLEALKKESGGSSEIIQPSIETSPPVERIGDVKSGSPEPEPETPHLSSAISEENVESAEEDHRLTPDDVLVGDSSLDYGHSDEEVIRKEIPDPRIEKWKRWWMLPLWVGVGVTVAAGFLMFLVYQATQVSFWFACTWVPFLIGVALIFIAWGLRRSRWIHVRITQAPGEWPRHIAFSIPLPLGLAAWFIRTFKKWIPSMSHGNIDEVIDGLSSITSDEPFYIEVEEGEGGERVEIFIG
jgi:hypothetical protein